LQFNRTLAYGQPERHGRKAGPKRKTRSVEPKRERSEPKLATTERAAARTVAVHH
jgi:hypothetical protein